MSFVAAAGVVSAAVAIGTAVYTSSQQRKAMHQQQDAVKAAQEADARAKVEAETGAAVAANSATAEAARRKRSNALALGAPTGATSTLGSASHLGAGSNTVVASKPASTVLGSAAR